MSASCYLCVERPPPDDLRSHLLYHHQIENDEALPSIISLGRRENIETQTTVTWVSEFEYFDNRKRSNYENSHFEEHQIKKSNNSFAKFQRNKNFQSSKRNRRYPNHIPPTLLTQKKRIPDTERKSSSHEHIQKGLEECLTGTDQEQNWNLFSPDGKPRGNEETTSNSKLNSIENIEIDNKMTESKHLGQGDNILQLDFTKDVVRESNSSSSKEKSDCYYEDFDNGDGNSHKDSKSFTKVRGRDDDMDTSAVSHIDKVEKVTDERIVTDAHEFVEENNTQSTQAQLEEIERNVTPEVPEFAEGYEKQSILKNLMSQGSLSIIKPSGEDCYNILMNDDKLEEEIRREEDVSMKVNNLGTSISITRIPSMAIVEKTESKMPLSKLNGSCSLGEAEYDQAFYSDEESEEENK